MLLYILFLIPVLSVILTSFEPVFAADPIRLDHHPLNGQFIGRHIEYLSHQAVIDRLIKDMVLEPEHKTKLVSGRLISDKDTRVTVSWTQNGYTVHFQPKEPSKSARSVEIRADELLRPDISSRFAPSETKIPRFDFSSRPCWIRFSIVNAGKKPDEILLELDKHLFEYIHIYISKPDFHLLDRQSFTLPLSERRIKHKHFVFRLPVPEGRTTYYLFVNSWNKRSKDTVPLRIWSKDAFIRHISDDGLFSGIVVGLFCLVFIYNISIFLFIRDPSFIFLAIVTFCQLLLEMSASGTGFKYLWPENPVFTWPAIYMNTALVMGFNLLFYRSFLNISRYSPLWDKIVTGMSTFFIICALSFFILPMAAFESMLWFLFLMDHVYSLPVLVPTVMALKARNRSGLFVLAGIFFYYVGLVKFGLAGSGLLQGEIFNYLPVKGLSFLLIMTLGLAHKFSVMRKSVMELNVNLEKRVEQRTKALEKANKKLKELDTLKTRFFDNISHEFRTPLTLITTPITSLLKGDYGKIPQAGMDVISTMKSNADRLLRLINDLLDFSKIEAGKMDVPFENHNISAFVSFCVSSVDSTAKAKGIRLSLTDKTNHLTAAVNKNLMEKAVFNLLSNAIKFTPEKGRIDVTLQSDTTAFTITVKDTGIGIPDDQLDSIFDRFTQVDPSHTRRHEGTGIGLSLTREIVKLHHGEISVSSKMGKGSLFTIIIPIKTVPEDDSAIKSDGLMEDEGQNALILQDTVSADKEIENSPRKNNAENKTILIVEDNDEMRHYLNGFLKKRFHTVTAPNGKAALQKLEQEKIDLILSDLMMPEMDGYELVQAVRSLDKYEGLPILLLTAKAQVPDKIEGFEKGANDYIIKPFDPQELCARITSQLKLKSLRDNLVRSNQNLKGKRKILTEPSKIKIELVKEFLDENYSEDILRDDLAQVADMSPDHLGKMFLQHTGLKISDYIRQLRIKAASDQLAATDMKIIDIAFSVGFGSLRSFNQAFRDIMNETPSNYRKKAANRKS